MTLGAHDVFPERFDEVCSGIIERLRLRREEIAQVVYDTIEQEIPGPLGDEYQAGLLAAIIALLDYSLEAIERGPDWRPCSHPPEVTAQVRRAARNGVGLGLVMRRSVVGHSVFTAFVEEEIKAITSSDNGSSISCLGRIQGTLAHLTAWIEHDYNGEIAGLALVERLLAGEHVDQSVLDYKIDGRWHTGVVATSARAEKSLQGLGQYFGCDVWSVLSSEGTLWAWFGRPKPLASADIARMMNARASPGFRLATGEPGKGLTGLRTTHRQAQQALRVFHEHCQVVTQFRDVAILALLQDDAQSLIDIFLSPLNAHSNPEAMRKTLRAYFEAGHNGSSAGSAIGLDRRTVSVRLDWIQEAIGRRIPEISAELDIALRLERLLALSSETARED